LNSKLFKLLFFSPIYIQYPKMTVKTEMIENEIQKCLIIKVFTPLSQYFVEAFGSD
jgi:hypothetical protein